ncbi:MAG: hypothetical protein TREMPRED_005400 [Tremellales sp. Tagirdzhanova-0007]|nr:MAG: hypothetical protein TREMPRED_005400 [Tremellales sp. Tagirdzhanova-0007]
MAELAEHSPGLPVLDLKTLGTFQFSQILSQNSITGSIYLRGTIHEQDAIIHLQRTVLPSEKALDVIGSGLAALNVYLENKPYFSAHGYLTETVKLPDLQIAIIWPATPIHIKKYTAQPKFMVRETPEIYEAVVRPYIDSFPPERLEWVYNILDGVKEAERVLYSDEDEDKGFMIVPDLKWDQTSMSALYLTVLVRTRTIQSMRDLTSHHIPLLREIQAQTHHMVMERFGVRSDELRMFVHYQPSYYHFHVHVVHIEHVGLAGMTVGQAHLLDDIISLLELSPEPPAASLLAKMTFTYALGIEHGLYPGLSAGQRIRPFP